MVSVAVLLVVPVPPLVELTGPVMLVLVPLLVPVMLREIVHELLMGIEPPLKESEVLPEIAPLKVPPQPLVIPGVLATCSPPVSVSLKATPFSATVLTDGLVSVKVRVVVPPGRIVAARNALLMVGGATTARLAEAVPPVPPCVEVTAPVVLFLAPAAVPVTFTAKLSEPLAARLAPDRRDHACTLRRCHAFHHRRSQSDLWGWRSTGRRAACH